MKTKINPQFVTNVSLVHMNLCGWYKYKPAHKKKVIRFSMKRMFYFDEKEMPAQIKELFYPYGWKTVTGIRSDCIIYNNNIYYKPYVRIYVSGQEHPYKRQFNTEEDAERYYDEITELIHSRINRKSHRAFEKYIEI